MTRKGRARFITGGQSPDPRLRGRWSSRDERAARKLARKKAKLKHVDGKMSDCPACQRDLKEMGDK